MLIARRSRSRPVEGMRFSSPVLITTPCRRRLTSCARLGTLDGSSRASSKQPWAFGRSTSSYVEGGFHPQRLGGLHALVLIRSRHAQADQPPDRRHPQGPLRGNWQALAGAWSRRIDDEHRLVYLVDGDDVVILQARYHY